MAVEGAVVTRLEATSAVTSLVGSGASARIYPEGHVPEGSAVPYVAYRFIGGPRSHAMGADPGPFHSRLQVTSADDGYDGARALAQAVENSLDRWSGTEESTTVDVILVQNEGIDNFEPKPGAAGRFEVIQDFMVHWR